jgi:hypothetical protein
LTEKGDTTLSLENYGKFLNLWKDADRDLPELLDAKITPRWTDSSIVGKAHT